MYEQLFQPTDSGYLPLAAAYDPPRIVSDASNYNDLGLESGGEFFGTSYSTQCATHLDCGLAKYLLGQAKAPPENEDMPRSSSPPQTPTRNVNMNMGYKGIDLTTLVSQYTLDYAFSSPDISVNTAPWPAIRHKYIAMTPSSFSGSETPSSVCANSSNAISPDLALHSFDTPEMERQPMSPSAKFRLHSSPFTDRPHVHSNMIFHGVRRKAESLQQALIRSPTRAVARLDYEATMNVARAAMYKCDYPGCRKAFRRTEHLKRHKQTSHEEGRNRFSCEFCGKDQFNRQDNLNIHRRLHARPNIRNRGVRFVSAAVPVIRLEEQRRKRRSVAKSKRADR